MPAYLHKLSTAALTGIGFLLLLLMLLLGRYAGQVSVDPLGVLLQPVYGCDTSVSSNISTFTTYVTDQRLASDLATILCDNPVLNRQYGQIKVFWGHSESELIQYVGKGIADLVLAKENIMSAFAAPATYGYRVAAYYKDYSAYLIALKEKPEISKEYLLGKKLGLLDYPSSRSGHIIPKQMMKELGITPENMDITYVNSHSALRELLSSGHVDIISSYWKDDDNKHFSSNYITPVKDKISGNKWYLKMDRENTDLMCSIQSSLRALAQSQTSPYFNKIIFPPICLEAS